MGIKSSLPYKEFIYLSAHQRFSEAEKLITKLERGKLIKWIRYHFLGSMLYEIFPILEELALDRGQTVIFWEIIGEIVEVLANSPVDVVIFKGGHIKDFYPNPYWRMISDLDVYVRSKDMESLENYLLGSGFKRAYTGYYQHSYRYKGITVEVHKKFARRLYPDVINEDLVFKHSERIKGSVLYPNKDLEITIFYFHAYKSAYTTSFRAIWWLDEYFLKSAGAKPLKIPKVKTCISWFAGFNWKNLVYKDPPKIYRSFMGVLHALKLGI